MPDAHCFAEGVLHAFLLGEVSDDTGRAIRAHLETCPACEEAARRLDAKSDSAIRGLRRVFAGQAVSTPLGSAHPSVADAGAGQAPPRVAGYEILGELGRGGMGVVYKARQERPARLVALKMLRGGAHADPQRRARLLAEAGAIARLQHPHIVQVFEVGEYDGSDGPLPFLVLEHVAGGNLANRLAGTPQPPRQAALLVRTLAEAVHHAHGKGVIHRDLKPANILLTEEGTPKINDFGLARQPDQDLTASGAVLGTPSYMAPEQAGGDRRQVGPAADVYALGAILYEMLTGRPPFRGADVMETLVQVRTQEPVPPARLNPQVPRDLDTVCLKCLEKEPRQRYGSAGELGDDLERFLGGLPVRARPASRGERMRRWSRRNPALAALTAAVGLLLAVLLAGSLTAAWRLNRTAERAQQAERDAKDRLFEALLTRVQSGRAGGRPGQRFASLEAIRQAVEIAREQGRAGDVLPLRNEAIACLALPDLSREKEWEGNPPGTNGLGFDAAFERYAWSRADEGIRVRRLGDHAELFRLPTPPSDRVSRWVRTHFSPDGRYLAATYRQWGETNPLEVWDLEAPGGRRVVALTDAAAPPAFAADGRTLVARLRDGAVVVIDLPSGRERHRFQPGTSVEGVLLHPGRRGAGEGLALHPGGRLLAVSSTEPPRVQVCDLETGRVLRELPHPEQVPGLAWAPDGRLLAATCNDNRIHLWDGLSGKKEGELVGHRWGGQDLEFDPTGRWLASFGWDMTLRFWDVGARRQVLDLEDIRVVGFRTRGGLAAAGLTGRQVRLWAFRPSEVHQELHAPVREIDHLEFSPDGRWLATDGLRSELRVWDVGACREAARAPGLRRLLWGPAGDWFLAEGDGGFVRGPVLLSGPGGTALRLGPPMVQSETREDVRGEASVWVGPDCQRLATIRYADSRVRVLEVGSREPQVLWQDRHANVYFLAASPDGCLLATGSFEGGSGVQIREAATGRLVRDLPIGDACVVFSPDGRRLYTATGRVSPDGAACRAWRVGSWDPERTLPLSRSASSPAALAAADGTVAVAFTVNDVRLLHPETLAEIATLTNPDPQLNVTLRFSSDGSTLATSADGGVHLWDLRRLHTELAGLGLDWHSPPAPPKHPLGKTAD
jgi:WD40 repeat protein/tRNA A-37 threonylcarbamoyl transferase component Bud32